MVRSTSWDGKFVTTASRRKPGGYCWWLVIGLLSLVCYCLCWHKGALPWTLFFLCVRGPWKFQASGFHEKNLVKCSACGSMSKIRVSKRMKWSWTSAKLLGLMFHVKDLGKNCRISCLEWDPGDNSGEQPISIRLKYLLGLSTLRRKQSWKYWKWNMHPSKLVSFGIASFISRFHEKKPDLDGWSPITLVASLSGQPSLDLESRNNNNPSLIWWLMYA